MWRTGRTAPVYEILSLHGKTWFSIERNLMLKSSFSCGINAALNLKFSVYSYDYGDDYYC